MTGRSPWVGRLILVGLIAGVMLGTFVIVAAIAGAIPAKPILDIMAIVCGSIVCGVAIGQYIRRTQR